jgi:hypothetical protein
MGFKKFTQAEAWKPLTAEEVLIDPKLAKVRLEARQPLRVEPKKP